jgi:hypothetical protein
MVQLGTHRTEAGFYVAQTLPVSELSEGHGEILVPVREASQVGVAVVTSDAAPKLSIWQEGDQLREHGAAQVHEPLWAILKLASESSCRSNRGMAKTATRRNAGTYQTL